jgi:RNA polymerase sigma factor (sigma-70 family)
MELQAMRSDAPVLASRGFARRQGDATITPIRGIPAVTHETVAPTGSVTPVPAADSGGELSGPAAADVEAAELESVLPNQLRDTGAYAELYVSQHDRLVRLAFVLTGSREVAEDVVQDSFVRLYKHWFSAERPEQYVRQIVVNGCRSHHRRAGRQRDKMAKLYVLDAAIDRHGVELSDVLLDLPYRQRAAIVLRYYSDLSEVEIAEVLGCRPGTVGSLIHRGLARLRMVMEQ